MENSVGPIREGSSQLMIYVPLLSGSRQEVQEDNQELSNTNCASENPPPPEYRECMKNHAAILGVHVVDGCGEFMLLPNSLTCAACGCHRNFHRRLLDPVTTVVSPLPLNSRCPLLPSPLPHTIHFAPNTNLTLNTAVTEQDHRQAPVMPSMENPVRRKRLRSKFTQLQKERMYSFSEKAGWKMQGCNEVELEELCKEIGVTRDVVRVWMHNNKKTVGEKDSNVINSGTINGSTSFSQ